MLSCLRRFNIVIRANIDPRLERRFRELAMRRFGYSKGALSKAVEEAIIKWISSIENENESFEGDPIEAIEGILSDIDMESVFLQHKIKDLWASKGAEERHINLT